MADLLTIENNEVVSCDKSAVNVVLPENITRVRRNAFLESDNLESIKINADCKSIGEAAFFDCKALKSVELPEGLEQIGAEAFKYCVSLESITLHDGVTEIAHNAFSFCESLSSISIPSSITKIGKNAFYNCKCLSKVILADNFEKVPAEWFDSLNKANPNYEIVCTKDSSTYKAVSRSQKLRTHIKDLALQVAKDKKIATVNKVGADALLSTLRSSVEGFSFQILATTKSATVAMVQIGKNIGVFKLGADSSKWLPKVKKVIEAFSDSSKSGEEIFDVIKKQKLPLGEISKKKSWDITFKADSEAF